MPEPSPNVPQTAPKVLKRRKITMGDVEDMAKLVAKRIDEKGACLMLGIKPQSWYDWKGRNQNNSKFVDSLARIRETKLNACIDAIDEAGDDRPLEVVGKNGEVRTITKPGDWRAKAWLAERVLAAERFGDRPQVTEQKTPMIALISSDLAASVFGKLLPAPDAPKAIVDAQVIADTTNKANG